MNNIQKAFNEKAQRSGLRMANGGTGLVNGPGTGTSDSVPAMYSKGEYVLPSDTVEAVGIDKLDALKDATHTPVNNGLRGVPHLVNGGTLTPPGPENYGNPNSTMWSRMTGQDEGAMNDAVANGTATPEQTAAQGRVQTNLADPSVNNPYDVPVMGGIGVGMRSAVDAGSGLASKAAGAVGDAASSAWSGLRNIATRSTAAAAPAVEAAAPSIETAAVAAAKPTLQSGWTPFAQKIGAAASVVKAPFTQPLLSQAGDMYAAQPSGGARPTPSAQPVAPQAAPAPVSTDPRQNFITQSNANMGLSAADQQGATDMSGQGLRGANAALGQNPTGKPTFNLGTYGGDATIFGQAAPGSNKVNSFTGTGTTPDDHGALQDQLTAQSVARMNNTANLTRQVNGLRTAAADNANTGAIQFGSGGGGTITAAAAGARNAHEANQISEANSIRSNDTARWTGERQLAQNLRQMTWDRNKFSVEQGNKDREFSQQQGQNTFANKQASEKSLNDQILQAHTTTGSDGKPIVDNDGANATRQGLETMVARQIQDLKQSGSPNDLARAQNLSDNGVNALSPDMRANGIAAVKLMNKVNAGSSNFNPLKPDPLASSDPRDYMNMKTNASGGSVTRTGQVIPSRFMDKKDSDYFMGQPTNEFSGLRARK